MNENPKKVHPRRRHRRGRKKKTLPPAMGSKSPSVRVTALPVPSSTIKRRFASLKQPSTMPGVTL